MSGELSTSALRYALVCEGVSEGSRAAVDALIAERDQYRKALDADAMNRPIIGTCATDCPPCRGGCS